MAWAPDFLEDGDTASAASINSRLLGAQSELNTIGRDNIRRGAINFDMAPRPSPFGPYTIGGGDDGEHTYPRSTFGASLDYTTFGADGGSRLTGVYTGDRILVGHPDHGGASATPEAVLTLNGGTGIRLGFGSGDLCTGLLVLFNANVKRVGFSAPAPAGLEVMFCIQYKSSGSATWFTVPSSERFVSRSDHVVDATSTTERMDIDVPIVCWLDDDNLDGDGLNPATMPVTHVAALSLIHI